jgi:CRP-like cAMP-binding protein
MNAQELLNTLGPFTTEEVRLFESMLIPKTLRKQEMVLDKGEVCRSVYFIVSGSFVQYQAGEITDTIIDLHLPGEWMFNHPSLVEQQPSHTCIKAFADSELLELPLSGLHYLLGHSPAFVQLGKLFNQPNLRTFLFDNALTPAQKYAYLKQAKPLAVQLFPNKMIASFLKIAPETLSRVRAAF